MLLPLPFLPSLLWGRRNNAHQPPKDAHLLILPGTYEHAILHGKWDFANAVKLWALNGRLPQSNLSRCGRRQPGRGEMRYKGRFKV